MPILKPKLDPVLYKVRVSGWSWEAQPDVSPRSCGQCDADGGLCMGYVAFPPTLSLAWCFHGQAWLGPSHVVMSHQAYAGCKTGWRVGIVEGR